MIKVRVDVKGVLSDETGRVVGKDGCFEGYHDRSVSLLFLANSGQNRSVKVVSMTWKKEYIEADIDPFED